MMLTTARLGRAAAGLQRAACSVQRGRVGGTACTGSRVRAQRGRSGHSVLRAARPQRQLHPGPLYSRNAHIPPTQQSPGAAGG
jgi:hypothetical protein